MRIFKTILMVSMVSTVLVPSFALAVTTARPADYGITGTIDTVYGLTSDPIDDSCWKYIEVTISNASNAILKTYQFCKARNVHIKETDPSFGGFDLVVDPSQNIVHFIPPTGAGAKIIAGVTIGLVGVGAAAAAATGGLVVGTAAAGFGLVAGGTAAAAGVGVGAATITSLYPRFSSYLAEKFSDAEVVFVTKYNPTQFGGCSCQVQSSYIVTPGIDMNDAESQGMAPTVGEVRESFGGTIVLGKAGDIVDRTQIHEDTPNSFTSAKIMKDFTAKVAGLLADNRCPDGVQVVDYAIPSADPNTPTYQSKATVWLNSCAAQKRVPMCCCVLVEQGLASKQYSCTAQTLLGPQTCNAALGTDKTIKYEPRQVPPQGCSSIGNESLNYQVASSGFGISTDRLRTEAQSLNPAKLTTVADLVKRAITALMMSIGSILFVMYVYAGGLWMFAAGQEEMISKAKSILVWSTLGVAVMLGSYAIVNFVINALTTPL